MIPFPAPFLGDAALADELANPELAALVGAPGGSDGAADPAARHGGGRRAVPTDGSRPVPAAARCWSAAP